MKPTYEIINSGLASALDFYTPELIYNVPAAGTPWNLIPAQGSGSAMQWIIVGTGSVSLSTAIAQTICVPLNGKIISQDPEALNLATGLVTYFTNVPAAAAAAYCIGFILGGVQATQFFGAQVTVINKASAIAINPSRIVANYSTSTSIPAPITLSSTNTILKNPGDPASGIVYGTDNLVVVPSRGIVFGALQVTFTTDAPANGDQAILNLKLAP